MPSALVQKIKKKFFLKYFDMDTDWLSVGSCKNNLASRSFVVFFMVK